MRKFLLCYCVILSGIAWAVSLLVSPHHDHRDHVAEAAKRTVIVECPHAIGTGVTAIRRTPMGNPIVFVWTAAHIVTRENRVLVKQGNHESAAHVVVRSEFYDVALLQLDSPADGYTGVEFDSDEPPRIGSPLFHIGNMLQEEFFGSVSFGVSSKHDVHGLGFAWPVADTTDAMICSGSSGGGIFRPETGRLAGLAVAVSGGRIGVYVPVRVLRLLAPWAVDGDRCPSAYELSGMAVASQAHPPQELELPCHP